MKKFLTYLLTFVFLATTIGVEVRAHYCDGVLMQVAVNGLQVNTPSGSEMPGCCDGEGCPLCKNIHQIYKIHSHYGMGQVVLVQPSVCASDWFHGDLPVVGLAGIAVYLPYRPYVAAASFGCLPRSHPRPALPSARLRAPPVA